jgi:L-fuconolactonase
VLRVDGHCHVSPVWYEPVETLRYQMTSNHIDQAVLVQALGQYDNSYLEECVRAHSEQFVAVVAVDVARPEAGDELAALAERGATGVRLRPEARSPGADPLAVWRVAEREGLAVSCVGSSAKFATAQFEALARALPDLPIVLEHLGGTSRPDETYEDATLRRRVFDLAALPNIYLKVPGLGELAPRRPVLPTTGPAVEAQPAILSEALARFGADRLFAVFPVVSREGYTVPAWVDALACPRQSSGHRFSGHGAARLWAARSKVGDDAWRGGGAGGGKGGCSEPSPRVEWPTSDRMRRAA